MHICRTYLLGDTMMSRLKHPRFVKRCNANSQKNKLENLWKGSFV